MDDCQQCHGSGFINRRPCEGCNVVVLDQPHDVELDDCSLEFQEVMKSVDTDE